MYHKKYLLLLLPIAVMTGSCSQKYYIPNTPNVPLFKEAGEARLSAGVGGSDEVSTTEVKAAYTPIKHLGIVGSYMHGKGGGDEGNSGYGHIIEGGLGYYLPIERDFVFEVYGGFGGGNVKSSYSHYDDNSQMYVHDGSSELGFVRAYLQPSIGYTTPWFDIAVSMRYSNLHYNSFSTSYITNSEDAANIAYIKDHPTTSFLDEAITIRGGWKYIKLQGQYLVSQKLNNSALPVYNNNFNFGVYLSLAKWYNTGKRKE
jgi:hypothetical protein